MKKYLKYLLVFVLIIPCFFLTACIQGKSAYEIAVENGYSGTETEWLASLNGNNGVNGKDGEDGSVSITEIYNKAVEEGYTGTYLEFLKEYLQVDDTLDETYINESMLSVVSIYCNFTRRITYWYGSMLQNVTSAGSGIIYNLDKENGNCYIITNYHVVYDSQCTTSNKISNEIYVYLYGYTDGITASYLGGTLTYDIAVLKISNSEILKNSDAKEVVIGDSNSVVAGETCYAIGNPEGEGISVTQGVVSVDSEELTMTGADDTTEVTFRVIRTDCAINGGNSGGGLFNSKGEFIGTVNAKIVDEEIEGIGYAIPSAVTITVAKNIIRDCGSLSEKFSAADLGLTIQTTTSKGVWNTTTQTAQIIETISVKEVTENSVASNYFKVDDIIKSVTINEKTTNITRYFMWTDFILGLNKNDTITVIVLRDNVETTLNITLPESCFNQVK